MFWKLALRPFSPGGKRGRLQTFIFHRVLSRRDPLLPGEPDVAEFEWMLDFISRAFNVLTFGEAMTRLREGRLPPRAACITFDDGYRDNFDNALPILARHGLPATFFIASAFLDGGRMWNDDVIEAVRRSPDGTLDLSEHGLGCHTLVSAADRARCIGNVLGALKYRPHFERARTAREIAHGAGVPEDAELMMSSGQLRSLFAFGMEVGGHTRTHPILRTLGDDDAQAEIDGGKFDLEKILGAAIETFAYPNGRTGMDLEQKHAAMVERAGFKAAVTTDRGNATADSSPYLVPRFTPWDRTPARFALRCALQLANSGPPEAGSAHSC